VKYDVIIVGARCAGSSLAMLLARDGARVLLTDRATFPSDTLNGHYVHPAGVRSLQRWGLLDSVLTPGGPRPVHTGRMDYGSIMFTGKFVWPDGQRGFAIAPRRHRLDMLLVEAAARAGVEVRQAFPVDDLVWDGERVVGIRGRRRDGDEVEERADVIVGADGLHSVVASKVAAQAYEVQPAQTCAYYSHWADMPPAGLEIWLRPT
jgi:2-polyprenyl-6-methoxyphenol hydroxylase-like FAD-dependent oxidoreductase